MRTDQELFSVEVDREVVLQSLPPLQLQSLGFESWNTSGLWLKHADLRPRAVRNSRAILAPAALSSPDQKANKFLYNFAISVENESQFLYL